MKDSLKFHFGLILILISCHQSSIFKIKNCTIRPTNNKTEIRTDGIFEKNLRLTRLAIKNNSVNAFFESECFACNCYLNRSTSHGEIDCFETLLDSLDYSELKLLYFSLDSNLYNKICTQNEFCRNEMYHNKSMWETINKVYRKKSLTKDKKLYYSRMSIINQIGIDTVGYYIREIDAKSKNKYITIYKFFRDGTYKEYWFDPNPVIVDLESRFIGEGQFYISSKNKTLTLEQIYLNSDYSNYNSYLYSFSIKNKCIILLNKWSSESNLFQNYNRLKYSNYKSIELGCKPYSNY